ncbi:hypothetical protein D3C87_1249920 [compost metagenome]
MHGQAFEHFEEEEAGERQDDEQQCVFDRPVAFQVLVHRVDKTHTEAAAAEGCAVTTGDTAAQGLLQIG